MRLRTARRARAAALCLAAALGLAGCSGEADKAAKPAAGFLSSLGIGGLSYRKAQVPEPGAVSLMGVTGSLGAMGTFEAGEILVRGLQGGTDDWSASSVVAERVTGALKAARVSMTDPAAKGGRAVSADGYAFEGVETSLMGAPVSAGRASVARDQNLGTVYRAGRLRVLDPATLPASLAPLAGADWDVEVLVRNPAPGRVGIEVRHARSSDGYDLSANLSLILPAGRDATYLSGMSARDLFDPSRWPEGVQLRAFDASGVFPEPPGGLPPEGSISDPGLGRTIATARSTTAVVRWTLAMVPPSPIAMRDLGEVLRRPDATAALGLESTVRPVVAIVGAPGRSAGPARR